MKKKAFTMIELVMVIVVLGIVASIGSEIFLSLYNNYLRSRAIHQLESQTQIVLEQIAKRLQYRIKDSTIARQEDGTFTALEGSDSTYSIIEWIGYSNESFLDTPPGWTGLIDLDHTNTNKTLYTLKTPDSNLSSASATMSALTDGAVDLTTGKEAALIFETTYNATDFGWGKTSNTDGAATVIVTRNTDDILTIDAADIPNDIYEHYVLAHSAYAIVPSDFNSTDFNLTLRYNYQPWLGQNYDSNPTNTYGNSTLAEHVSLFQFKQDDTVIRLKLCLHDNNQTGTGDRIAICKEKVVY